MTDADLAKELHSIQFLDDLSEDVLQRIASVARTADYPASTVVFHQGDPATNVYFVSEGLVALEICTPGTGCRRILTVGPGELLGWSPMLEQERLTATARTLMPTRTVAIDGKQVTAICEGNSRFGYELMKRTALALAKRLDATRLQLIDVYDQQLQPAPDQRSAP